MKQYQNLKTFLQKVTFQIGLKKFLWLQKLKIPCRGHMLLTISDLNGKQIVRMFHEKELNKKQKKKQKEFSIEKSNWGKRW